MRENLEVTLAVYPHETMQGATLEYGWVKVEGVRLRTIVSVPGEGKAPFPAVVLIQGSCVSPLESL